MTNTIATEAFCADLLPDGFVRVFTADGVTRFYGTDHSIRRFQGDQLPGERSAVIALLNR